MINSIISKIYFRIFAAYGLHCELLSYLVGRASNCVLGLFAVSLVTYFLVTVRIWQIVISTLVLLIATGSTSKAASTTITPVYVLRPHSGHSVVTRKTVKAIRQALGKSPEFLPAFLNAHNVAIVVLPTIDEKFENLAVKPREGFPNHTNRSLGGLYDGTNIYIFQSKLSELTNAQLGIRSPTELVSSLFHECGHALDIGPLNSDSFDFKTAYQSDLDAMKLTVSKSLTPFLCSSAFCRHEIYAEMVKENLLAGATGDISMYLPQTSAVVKRSLQRFSSKPLE